MRGKRGRERRGEVGKEGMVAGWFIACKTPEAAGSRKKSALY